MSSSTFSQILSDWAKYDIQMEYILDSAKKTIQIYIEPLYRKAFSLEVKSSDTINKVKAMINDKIGIPPDKQSLYFGWKPLNDDHTIADCTIKKGCTLYVFIERMQVPVMSPTGQIVTLYVACDYTFDNVKGMIQHMEGIPPSWEWSFYYFNEFELMGGGSRGFADCNIRKGSTLFRGVGKIQISITTLTGEFTTLEVRRFNTIDDIKAKIEAKVHIPPDQQKLFDAYKQLQEDCTLTDCYFEKKPSLFLVILGPPRRHKVKAKNHNL